MGGFGPSSTLLNSLDHSPTVVNWGCGWILSKFHFRRFLRSLASGREFGDFDGLGQNLSFLDHSLAVVNWGNHQICLLRSVASGSEFGDLGNLDGFCQNSTP